MSKSELPLTDVAVPGCAATPRTRPPLDAETATELAGMFKALSDPIRLRLLSAIAARAGQEACVCDVSDGIDVGQPTISHHLKVLREAGLLTSERRASWVYYRVVPQALQQLSRLLATEAGAAVTA
ncbi:ArsR/SmtB family transcription factor [Nocardia terpenica]|uniref:Metalloregulator ArsR/SmtB family transcription factor n=1 Tax=Nocardia terpenica TaxID=455432 RepID=A0A6G9Z660_9NOCA|nr:metalloregulator ArsR/SmtB family transcription factor [Nocardia terpenica]QIS20940.1 metalloregulator ArsR/SmtB family transcription factor [Nocardia terpenica]